VPTAASDADAFVVAQAEVGAQQQVTLDAFTLWVETEGPESATALNALEMAIVTSIDHVGALGVRPCYAPWHRAAVEVFETLADGLALHRAGAPSAYADANLAYALFANPRFVALFDCTGQVVVANVTDVYG
jgi:hypothetical protein